MARIVQKFGGTSVADLERIRNAARRVKREADAGNDVAVVVSAMAGTTNQLFLVDAFSGSVITTIKLNQLALGQPQRPVAVPIAGG